MQNMKCIGWVKFCTTSTSLSDPKSQKVEPWVCSRIVKSISKPDLEYNESPEQFFWKQVYASND